MFGRKLRIVIRIKNLLITFGHVGLEMLIGRMDRSHGLGVRKSFCAMRHIAKKPLSGNGRDLYHQIQLNSRNTLSTVRCVMWELL